MNSTFNKNTISSTRKNLLKANGLLIDWFRIIIINKKWIIYWNNFTFYFMFA
jgi:hypothetical protein